MDRQERVARTADALAAEFGGRALDVATTRAKSCLADACQDWLDVVNLLGTRAAELARQPEPTLEDVLRGQVTQQVMAADGVNADGLEQMLVDVSKDRTRAD
jgi:hypothetical protein